MKTFLNFLKFSLILLVSSSAFADGWFLKVNHPSIKAIAVERNVLTVFFTSHEVPPFRCGPNTPKIKGITPGNLDHDLINHHGFSMNHYHATLVEIDCIGPIVLRNLLGMLNFTDEQREQIAGEYAAYLEGRGNEITEQPPLRPDTVSMTERNALLTFLARAQRNTHPALTVRLIQAYENNERERILESTLQDMADAESTTASSSTQDRTQADLETILENTLQDMTMATTFVALIALLVATGSIG